MNLAILSGRLSKEPNLKYIPNSGTPVLIFDIAVDRKYKKDNENNVDYFTIQCWGKLAEGISNNLDKGRKILVQGFLKNNHWKDENDKLHRDNLVIATKIEFLDYPKINEEELFMFVPTDMSLIEGEAPF